MVLNVSKAVCVSVAAAIAALFAASRLSAQPAVSGAGFTLSPVSVNLPNGSRAYPPGPGQAAMNGNCLTCHSAGMVLNQPALSRTAWEAEVNKMRAVYKAPVAAEDVPVIVGYLAAVKGTN